MICGVKTGVVGLHYTTILKNKNLVFYSVNNNLTNYKDGWEALYKEYLKIIINCYGFVNIYGSIHCARNYGDNSNDFYYSQLKSELIELCNCLELEPNNLKIYRLELGVNLRAPPTLFKILEQAHICYSGKPFKKWKDDKNQVTGLVIKNQQYRYKFYNKSAVNRKKNLLGNIQFSNEHEEIIRYEIQYYSIKLKAIGIYTVSDLFDFDKVIKLENLLLYPLKNVVFKGIDVDSNSLNPKDSLTIKNGYKTSHWKEIKQKKSIYNSFKQKYKRVLLYNSKLNIREVLIEKVQSKWQELIKN